ncbi:MAG TPA: RnfABCDGE type electron transport complex subunit D [Rhodocyclaceae bacterium]|nr:RnfABCDGE type electron transport complex subunit D [Rhodocyclaceae bacterium]
MDFNPAPFFLKPASVSRVMLTVGAALIPGVIAYVAFFGPGILKSLAIASVAALLFEALMLQLRGKPITLFLKDGSALLTAWLLALSLPPTAPWWLVVVAVFFAIVIAKHLYGGLGQNPFNPAMVGFAVCIVSFPALMGQWPGVDALTAATPLDHLKTALKLGEGQVSVATITADRSVYGLVAGRGWEWIAAGYLVGGVALIGLRIITWHIPVAFLGVVLLLTGGLWLFDAQAFASPLFHLFGGATMLGAFFIATDPVSGATTPRGKLIFGAGCGLLAVLIRVFGGYPDGMAFAVLLMNLCAPVIDMFTQPPVFGAQNQEKSS